MEINRDEWCVFFFQWVALPLLVFFRFILAAFNSGLWIHNAITREKFIIFFTNWTYTVLVIYFLAAFITSLVQLLEELNHERRPDSDNQVELGTSAPYTTGEPDNNGNQPGSATVDNPVAHMEQENTTVDQLAPKHKFLWFFVNVADNASLMVTIGFWAVIYDPDTSDLDFSSVTKHGLVTVFCLFDLIVSAIPIRLYHFIYSTIYVTLYLIFTVIYWQAGGTDEFGNPYIYKALDYNNFSAANAVTVAFFFFLVVPALQLIYFGVYKARDAATGKAKVTPP